MIRYSQIILAAALLTGAHLATGQQRSSAAEQPVRAFPSNDQVGIDVDRFVGDPFLSLPRITHESIIKRSILRHGDPHEPGEPGAVLQYRKDFAVATLMGWNETPLVETPEQHILMIQDGVGRLDNGSEYWDLREGIAVLIPPKMKHRIKSTSAKPLNFFLLTWDNPEVVTPRKDILVRDVHTLPFAEKNAHWSYQAKNIFHPSDGLHPNEKVLIVYMAPMTIGSPHPHVPQWEEVWTKFSPGKAYMMLGSEIREMPQNVGFIAPPNARTVHTVMNLSKTDIQSWFYFARYTRPAPDYKDQPSIKGKPLPRE
ncbi:MAG: AraC family ligand binding domain-containing protein [Bryobacteraceae bacterium]